MKAYFIGNKNDIYLINILTQELKTIVVYRSKFVEIRLNMKYNLGYFII